MVSDQLTVVLGVALAAYIIKVLWVLWTNHSSPLSSLPGAWHSKYSTGVLRYHTLRGRRIFYVDELHKRYGGIVRLSPIEVAVADLAGVSQIHKIGSGFIKSAFYEKMTPGRSPGIFAMRDPHAHAARRKLFARAFSNSAIRLNWEREIRAKVRLAVQRIKQDASGSAKGADVLKWWTLMATDVIAHLSFGESFQMLELGKQTPYIDALQAALLGGVLRSELPLMHTILRYLPFLKTQLITHADEIVDIYGAHAIHNMRNGNDNVRNLFSQILATCDSEEKMAVTDTDICQEAGNLIIAGSDTTAVTMTYLTWAVLQQPSLQAQLEEEVTQMSDDLTLVEVEAAPLLNSVISETLRLFGAAPGALPRVVPKQGMTINGYYIPGGIEVSTQAYTNHRDPSIFPDPSKFDGFRFMNTEKLSPQHKAAYMPFGGGSRSCIGLHLAYLELRLATAFFFRYCRGVRLSACMREDMMEMVNQFLIAPKGHCCYVTLKE